MIFLGNDNEFGSRQIDMTHTMYPSALYKISLKDGSFALPKYSTAYGIVLDGEVAVEEGRLIARALEYFCVTKDDSSLRIRGRAVIFVRHGFRGQRMVGGPIESSGRLTYIDNCSDTLLVYPPRFGDPSMSLLSFPAKIEQRFHIHPSIRLGVIVRGRGIAETAEGEFPLEPGVAFCVREKEVHRFITESEGLDAISFHPEGDWGPTDENHALLNRTYMGKFMNE